MDREELLKELETIDAIEEQIKFLQFDERFQQMLMPSINIYKRQMQVLMNKIAAGKELTDSDISMKSKLADTLKGIMSNIEYFNSLGREEDYEDDQ